MEHPTIIIKRTKEELRTYNLFSGINKSPFRHLLQYVIPVLGVIQIAIYIFMVRSPLNLAIGAFLLIYPFLTRYQIIRASDKSYDDNNLQDYQIKVVFHTDHFTTENDIVCQKLMYNDVHKVFNRDKDIIIYLSKYSGLYIAKESYDTETMDQIISLLRTAVPDKF